MLLLAGPKDVKDILASLKDSAQEANDSTDIVKHQVCFTYMINFLRMYLD